MVVRPFGSGRDGSPCPRLGRARAAVVASFALFTAGCHLRSPKPTSDDDAGAFGHLDAGEGGGADGSAGADAVANAPDGASGPDAADAGADALPDGTDGRGEAGDSGADAAVEPCNCTAGQICVGGVCQGPVAQSCSCTGWEVCNASGQCVAPPEQSQYRVGACYHDTGAWEPGSTPGSWNVSSANVFIPLYDQPGVRGKVRAQLQAMANAGAGFVKTILWYGDAAASPAYPTWEVAFPPTAQQLKNLHDYVVDVSTTLRPDGSPMELILSSGWLTAADVTIGDVTKDKIGWSCLSPADYLSSATQTYTSVLDAVKAIYRADGLPAVSLMYLWSEVQVCATDDDTDPGCQWLASSEYDACNVVPGAEAPMRNQQWFLEQLYPGFVAAARAAGIIPSVYFNGSNSEVTVTDQGFVDPFAAAQPDFAAVTQHRSMANVFRSAWWMKQHSLPVPPRFDLDFGPEASVTSPATLAVRFLDDLEAVLPTLYPGQPIRYGIVETDHPVDATARAEVGRAWAAERVTRGGNPEIVSFWSTPGDSVADNVSPAQFDFSAFSTDGLAFPFANLNGGFESSASGVLPDDWTTLVPASSPANAYWNTSGVRFGSADLRFDASRCDSGCASVESDPVAVTPGQTVAFHVWQENAQPSPAATGDAGTGQMTFSVVPAAGGTDGAALLQMSAIGNTTSYSPPYPAVWARYAGVVPIPAGVTSVRLRIGMTSTAASTTMDVDEVH